MKLRKSWSKSKTNLSSPSSTSSSQKRKNKLEKLKIILTPTKLKLSSNNFRKLDDLGALDRNEISVSPLSDAVNMKNIIRTHDMIQSISEDRLCEDDDTVQNTCEAENQDQNDLENKSTEILKNASSSTTEEFQVRNSFDSKTTKDELQSVSSGPSFTLEDLTNNESDHPKEMIIDTNIAAMEDDVSTHVEETKNICCGVSQDTFVIYPSSQKEQVSVSARIKMIQHSLENKNYKPQELRKIEYKHQQKEYSHVEITPEKEESQEKDKTFQIEESQDQLPTMQEQISDTQHTNPVTTLSSPVSKESVKDQQVEEFEQQLEQSSSLVSDRVKWLNEDAFKSSSMAILSNVKQSLYNKKHKPFKQELTQQSSNEFEKQHQNKQEDDQVKDECTEKQLPAVSTRVKWLKEDAFIIKANAKREHQINKQEEEQSTFRSAKTTNVKLYNEQQNEVITKENKHNESISRARQQSIHAKKVIEEQEMIAKCIEDDLSNQNKQAPNDNHEIIIPAELKVSNRIKWLKEDAFKKEQLQKQHQINEDEKIVEAKRKWLQTAFTTQKEVLQQEEKVQQRCSTPTLILRSKPIINRCSTPTSSYLVKSQPFTKKVQSPNTLPNTVNQLPSPKSSLLLSSTNLKLADKNVVKQRKNIFEQPKQIKPDTTSNNNKITWEKDKLNGTYNKIVYETKNVNHFNVAPKKTLLDLP